MLYAPDLPTDCDPEHIYYVHDVGQAGSLGIEIGQDCHRHTFSLILGDRHSGRSLTVALAPGQLIPDPRRGEDGSFELSVDREDPVTVAVNGSELTLAQDDSSALTGRLVEFDTALRQFVDGLHPDLAARVQSLTVLESEWASCMSDTIEIVTAEGVLAGAVSAFVVSGPVGVLAGAEVGAVAGAATGLVWGFATC